VGRGEDIVSGEIDWSVDPRQATWILLGYVAFVFYYLQTARLFWRPLGEIQTGTLEQVYLSPLPPWLIAAAGRVVAAVLETAVVVAAVAVASAIVLQPSVTWRVDALVPLAFLVAGGTGYSLILGGLALVWKRTEMINDAMAGILMMFGGLCWCHWRRRLTGCHPSAAWSRSARRRVDARCSAGRPVALHPRRWRWTGLDGGNHRCMAARRSSRVRVRRTYREEEGSLK
jgi:hypothetical protein